MNKLRKNCLIIEPKDWPKLSSEFLANLNEYEAESLAKSICNHPNNDEKWPALSLLLKHTNEKNTISRVALLELTKSRDVDNLKRFFKEIDIDVYDIRAAMEKFAKTDFLTMQVLLSAMIDKEGNDDVSFKAWKNSNIFSSICQQLLGEKNLSQTASKEEMWEIFNYLNQYQFEDGRMKMVFRSVFESNSSENGLVFLKLLNNPWIQANKNLEKLVDLSCKFSDENMFRVMLDGRKCEEAIDLCLSKNDLSESRVALIKSWALDYQTKKFREGLVNSNIEAGANKPLAAKPKVGRL